MFLVQKGAYEKIVLKSQVEKITELISQEEKVFVDVTAAWCLSCKVNEQLVLNTNEIETLFKNENIHKIVLDWTHYDKKITDYLQEFDRVGVPLYVYYNEEGTPIILPQLLTKEIIINVIKGEKK